jgi:predicted  nucleic acid-binding Zn-ribbon protein
MAGKVHTDSEALYAVRSAITKFASSFQEAQGSFAQCFEQMNYQVENYIRMLDSDIESCEEKKRALQRQIEECEEKQSTAQKEQSQHQNGRTDSFVCDRCGTRMMLEVYGDSTSCKSSSDCSGIMHRFFDDGEYHRLNAEIQQLEDKKKQLQERIVALDERIDKQEAVKGITVQNYSELQMHQQSIMSLLVFGSGEDPETAVAFIDKALASLGDYQAVGFDVDGGIEKKVK